MGVAIYIMAAIIMFIVPIPAWLLDILLAINISIALTVLFATMFSKEVLDMSFFPTMLLFTTIFPNSTEHLLHQTDPAGR